MKMHLHIVVHVLNSAQAITQALVAFDSGAKNVFLISHLGADESLPSIAKEIKALRPDANIGLNCLSSDFKRSFELAVSAGASALWFDDAGFHSESPDVQKKQRFLSALSEHHASGLEMDVFVGVGFKYQKADENPGKAAIEVVGHGCIPTTSGKGTGFSACPKVVNNIRFELNSNNRLALASGVSSDNFHLWKGVVSDIFVASSVSHDEYTLIPSQVAHLADLCID